METKILMLLAVFSLGQSASVASKWNGISNEDIRFAGTAEGKTFYAVYNSTTDMDWFAAGKACEEMNMRLAEIQSVVQSTAISALVYAGQVFNANYWVGGRDSWELSQFSWNSTKVNANSSGIILNNISILPQTSHNLALFLQHILETLISIWSHVAVLITIVYVRK